MDKQESVLVMDTSSIFILRSFPEDIFVKLWQDVHNLVNSHRIFLPIEVLNEVKRGDKKVQSWFKFKEDTIVQPSEFQIKKVQEILRSHPELIKERRYEADPFVIALALEIKKNKPSSEVLISTEEVEEYGETKIPNVCKNYKLESCSFFDFIRKNGWKY